ncbi:MAG: HEAT repeat domain-containing protein [Planctomycetes bacterium]|nr:HEAT repeat domain-containing protein [Planctomycetota bacterium]
MFNKKRFFVVSALLCLTCSFCGADELEDSWGDFLHYAAIGRFELAKGFAEKILDSNPDPLAILALSDANPRAYRLLLRMEDHSEDLGEVSGNLLELIERGRYIKRIDPKVIREEIKKLSGGIRPSTAAQGRLKNAGEYAIPLMIEALEDPERQDEFVHIVSALPKIGRDAVRPLTTALATDNISVKIEIIRALGDIGYSQSLAYLKYIIENDSVEQMKKEAVIAIKKIDPAALNVSASELFFQLAESYYYHEDSNAPRKAVIANVWLWDSKAGKLKRVEVDNGHFFELMAMRSCEAALKADEKTGKAIALWIAAFFKAEAAVMDQPSYFKEGHADAMTYATTAGPEYLHVALERALKDKNANVALGVVEALAANAGEKSLLYRIGTEQPLVKALSFSDIPVMYSSAIAIASANPNANFIGSKKIIENLSAAVTGSGGDKIGKELSDIYALRGVDAMYNLAVTRNTVIDLTPAQKSLIQVTRGSWEVMQIQAGRVLALMPSPDAQRATADMGLGAGNTLDVRIEAFLSLAVSAKQNANLLAPEQIDAIYGLVSSDETDVELRSSAAGAYGALNLPSDKVKELILDQTK